MLTWVFYDTSLLMVHMFWRAEPLPGEPVVALEPFRIANQYGLFAVMTPHRYEIEFQGSTDGVTLDGVSRSAISRRSLERCAGTVCAVSAAL